MARVTSRSCEMEYPLTAICSFAFTFYKYVCTGFRLRKIRNTDIFRKSGRIRLRPNFQIRISWFWRMPVQQLQYKQHQPNVNSAVISRWSSAAILDTIEPEIAPFDPPTRKPLPEPDMEWIGCTVCEIFAFKLYCDLETGVQGHSRSSKTALFDRAHTTLYSYSIVNVCLYLVPFSRYSRILVENCYPLYLAPLLG